MNPDFVSGGKSLALDNIMADTKKPTILIVDDNDVIRETYVQVFKQKGFDVLSGIDGVEGVDIATKELPDVILRESLCPAWTASSLSRPFEKTSRPEKFQ